MGPADALRMLVVTGGALAGVSYVNRQCRRPSGWLGRLVVADMNRRHAKLITWALSHLPASPPESVLDLGCGGGRLIQHLAAQGCRACGLDYSAASVRHARMLNATAVAAGRVHLVQANVSQLPWASSSFHWVTAVETHYYWPDRAAALQEIGRVLKPGGHVLIAAEAYRGRSFDWLYGASMKMLGGAYLTPGEHRAWLEQAGFTEVAVHLEQRQRWLCATGRKIS